MDPSKDAQTREDVHIRHSDQSARWTERSRVDGTLSEAPTSRQKGTTTPRHPRHPPRSPWCQGHQLQASSSRLRGMPKKEGPNRQPGKGSAPRLPRQERCLGPGRTVSSPRCAWTAPSSCSEQGAVSGPIRKIRRMGIVQNRNTGVAGTFLVRTEWDWDSNYREALAVCRRRHVTKDHTGKPQER